ncbi:MAG: hypothetical protein PHX68_04585, partial [Alphaproteobacteria bacterium]|nr:hypothetical protein [Alphaproteobacteria bacterium]
MREDPMPVLFACACHDMARMSDDWDAEHGARAVPLAADIMDKFTDALPAAQRQSALYAVAHHTAGRRAPDYVSACLWDADRTRLSWKNGYRAAFFATARARAVASMRNPLDYVAYQSQCMGKNREAVLRMFSHETDGMESRCARARPERKSRLTPGRRFGVCGPGEKCR